MHPILLTHICHIPLNTITWCATAQLSASLCRDNKRQWQRTGVRLLLQNLLNTYGIIDTLDDTQFPYRLRHCNAYVCFSHSNNNVAVIVSHQHAVGIDIEVQNIKWQVVKRFYHKDEIAILMTLPTHQQHLISKWLWQIKESLIKIHHHTLAQGLGINYASILPTLIEKTTHDMASPIIINCPYNNDNPYNKGIDIEKNSHAGYTILIVPQPHMVAIF